jgi:hypothetical protein
MRRERLRSVAKWGFTAAALALGVAWGGSGWLRTSLAWRRVITTVESGRLTMLRAATSTPAYRFELAVRTRDPVVSSALRPSEPFFSHDCAWTIADTEARWRWGFAWEPSIRDRYLPRSFGLPLWPLFAAAFIPTCVWWTRDIRSWRRRPGQCPACGYDRRGLGEGSPCPECGSAPAGADAPPLVPGRAIPLEFSVKSTLLSAVVVAAFSTCAWSQNAPQSQTQPPPPTQPNAPPQAQPGPPQDGPVRVLPQVLLGKRVQMVQQAAAVCGTVVIVSDASSYVEAIAHWTPRRRFPVLIDDGTPAAREDIGRFVRAFKPAHVVRWSAKVDKPAPWESADPPTIFATVAKIWGAEGEKPGQAQLLEVWKKSGFPPPGIVVTQTGDGAWPAALALAAGRGQLLAFITVVQGVNGALTVQQADEFEQAVEAAASASGFSWRTVGDVLDAVTLCNNAPARMENNKGEYLALTDRIGRISKGVENGERWAWCGQIFGNPEQSCYRAMCSLFLVTHKAWVFDGYTNGKPWSDFDGTEAAKLLRQISISVELDDTPHQGARDWRLRAARAVDADLILVNSSGNCDFFDLQPGQCKPGDVPILEVPAALHIVHSWSLEFPANRDMLGGRWFERGVFAYAGSVHEPYLNAFMPTPKLAMRMMAGVPFGVAVRIDGAPLWRIAVMADPLYMLGEEFQRVDDLVLDGASDVADGLRDLLTAGEYTKALDLLTILGRDAQAAQLAGTILKSKPEAFTPPVAAASVLALMRAGDNQGVLAAYSKLDAAHAADPVLRDALWLASYPLLEAPTDSLLLLLRANLRPDQIGRDATELAKAWMLKYGRERAETMLREVRSGLTDKGQVGAFEQAVKAASERWSL